MDGPIDSKFNETKLVQNRPYTPRLNRQELLAVGVSSFLILLVVLGTALSWWNPASVLSDVPYFAIASIIGVSVWAFRQRIERFLTPAQRYTVEELSEPALRNQLEEDRAPQPPAGIKGATSSARPGSVCDPGPYVIEPYQRRHVALDVLKGEKISGTIIEAHRLEFNWFIVNQRNLVRANRTGEFSYEKGEDGVRAAAQLRWRAPRDGPWYLLFDHAKRQYGREVHIDLRRE